MSEDRIPTLDPRPPAPDPRSLVRGITLIEMTITLAIIGLIAGISLPAVSAGLDSVHLTTASQSVAGFINAGVTRAERSQQPVELVISPRDNLLSLYTNDPAFKRELRLPSGITLQAVLPEIPESTDPVRRIVLLPGATVPGIGVQLGNGHGTRRMIRLDPMTGFPRVESVLPN